MRIRAPVKEAVAVEDVQGKTINNSQVSNRKKTQQIYFRKEQQNQVNKKYRKLRLFYLAIPA